MRFLLAVSRGIDATTTLLGRFTWLASLLLVLVGVQNVVARYGYQWIRRTFGDHVAAALSNNTYLELQTLLYNVIFLLGAAYVLRIDGHVRVDIVYSRLPARARAWIDILGTLFFLLPFAAMGIFFSHGYVASSWGQLETSPNPGGLARYPIKTLIVVTFALLCVQGLSQVIKHAAFLGGVPRSGSPHAAGEVPADDGDGRPAVATEGGG